MGILDAISLENEVFRAYAFWTAITVLKMLIMSPLTGRLRFKNKTFANAEDVKFTSPKGKAKFDDEEVERVRRAHRNDLENCIPFMIIGLFYVLTNPVASIAINIFRAGAISRILHTISYLNSLQPWRALSFFVCLGCTIYMSIQVAMFFY
ncbi:hypothetical protein PVAND_011982 [Polypedilum vanderplanki]|uniref:Microsomal glutathione S-transferase 1 n=1 Tax=Polypedilum vanderplanki TaxID=319348 RepID=A0A9J6CLX2_POLVA|nr:hypothetical protein PVAND_011982 [Polypedilum vanderplanki]